MEIRSNGVGSSATKLLKKILTLIDYKIFNIYQNRMIKIYKEERFFFKTDCRK